MEVSFGWSQETESSGWRKVNCVAREEDDDFRRILVSWLSSEDKAKAFMAKKPRWPVVYDILETECEFRVLVAAARYSSADSVRAELESASKRRSDLISFVTRILESGRGAPEPADAGDTSPVG